MPMHAPGQPMPAAARAPVFETQIPSEVLPPLAPWALPPVADNERELDAGAWAAAGELAAEAGQPLAGEPLHDDADAWLSEIMSAPPPEAAAPVNGVEVLAAPAPESAAPEGAGQTGGDPFLPAWSAVRDANIRPYADWRPAATLSLPVLQVRPQPQHQNGHGHGGPHGQQHGRHPQHGQQAQRHHNGGGGGGNDRGNRRKKRRGQRHERHNRPNRDRGPRLPGFYNPGGD
jgi:hypothetical protein